MTARGAPWDSVTNPSSTYFSKSVVFDNRGTDIVRTTEGDPSRVAVPRPGTQFGISNQPESLYEVVIKVLLRSGDTTIHIPPGRGLDFRVHESGHWEIVLGSYSGKVGEGAVLVATSGVWDGNFIEPPGGSGVTDFTSLSDTPANYTGSGGQLVGVNSGETALEFVDSPYDVAVGFVGTPGDGANLGVIYLPRSVSFQADFAGSGGTIETNPTAQLDIDVQDDGVSIGTISISTGGAFTFTTVGGAPVTVAEGSILSFVGPNPADATGAGIYFTLEATTP